ncbi:MAG TPA: ABC transporter ATP-binding protein/permease, partial [Candidatus Blautia faecigallinarum]|nr:ABC transporter ATP-binding protein/permease [Candidatus Blautia faecigallinarum]
MNRKLLQSVREYKGKAFLAPVLVALEVFIEVLIPLLMAKIIDVGIMEGDMGYIIKMGILLVFLAMLALFFGAKAGQVAAVAAAGYAKNLRHDIFYKIQDFSFGNIDHFSTSSLVTRMTTDITNVQMAFMFSIRMLARAPFMVILSWIMAATINIEIAFLLLIMIPILGGALIFIAKKAHPHFVEVFDEYDVLNNTVQENVNAARVVKAYVREEHENQKFQKISLKVFDLFTKAEKIVAWNAPIMQFVMYTVVICLVLIGGKSIVFETMQTGELTSIMVYAMQILMSLMMVTFVFVQIMIAEASSDRIREVLEEVPEMQDDENALKEVANGDIDFEHVDFSYSGKDGNLSLKDVNLHIKSGQIVGIIGGTGSAKSTLVQLIPRLYDVTKGCVKVGGVDVRKYNLEKLRDQVSMVLQKNVLFTGSIYENIRWGDENATDEEVQKVCRLAQADGFINEFPAGYNTMIVEGGNNVSGGQKQRLCIARALLKKPKILILDDSTSAVDTRTDALIRQAFREEIPDTTKIIIAQRISSVEDADVIIVMDNGEINGIGTSNELLKTNAIYREV